MVDGDGIVSHSENPIKSAKGKGKTRFLSSFCEKLVLDLQSGEIQGIGADESGKTTTTVSDLEICSILLVRGRRGGIVLGMQKTCDGSTFRRRNPKIGTSRIEDDLEALGWRADFDLGKVL